MQDFKASRTAMFVAACRGIADLETPALVRDDLAAELLPFPFSTVVNAAHALPFVSRPLLRVAGRLSAYTSRHFALRTRAIDDVVVAAVNRHVKQVVLLGAGLDARAYRLEALREVAFFEVDHPATQKHKQAATKLARPMTKSLTYVSMDFQTQRIDEQLIANGFDVMRPSCFVWEGVTMYLHPEAIVATLAALRRCMAPGSTLAMTYRDSKSWAMGLVAGAAAGLVGERFLSSQSPSEVKRLVEFEGLHVRSDEGNVEWAQRYLGRKTSHSMERLAIIDAR